MSVAGAYQWSIDVGARALIRVGLRPSQISVLSVLIALLGSLLFVLQRDPLVFAPIVLAGGFLDALDGAVARKTQRVTRFGGYLDAICDRAFDCSVLFAIADVSEHWGLCMLAVIFGYSVSYTKARAGIEMPVSNLGWPHLMGREERVITLVSGLLLWGLFPSLDVAGQPLVVWWLTLLCLGLFVTAGQRFAHARSLLRGAENGPL